MRIWVPGGYGHRNYSITTNSVLIVLFGKPRYLGSGSHRITFGEWLVRGAREALFCPFDDPLNENLRARRTVQPRNFREYLRPLENEKKGDLGPVGCRGQMGGGEATKRTKQTAWLRWPMGVSRKETSGSNQFMCDRFQRERERTTEKGVRKKREREEKKERERDGEGPTRPRTVCQLSDLLVRRHGETLFTTKTLVDNAGYPRGHLSFLFCSPYSIASAAAVSMRNSLCLLLRSPPPPLSR